MTVAVLVIRWYASHASRERAALAAALGVDLPIDDTIEIAGLRLEIVGLPPAFAPRRASRSAPGQAGGRLEVVATDPGPGTSFAATEALGAADPTGFTGSSGSPTSGPRFLALGWATLELERAAASRPDVRWVAAPRDSVVGARALAGQASTAEAADVAPTDPPPTDPPPTDPEAAAAVTIALLEPYTEGRLAASLARHGEGPAVIYVRVPVSAIAGTAARLARVDIRARDGTGPFGPEWAIVGPHASGPTLVLVPEAQPGEPGEPDRPRAGRRGTIG